MRKKYTFRYVGYRGTYANNTEAYHIIMGNYDNMLFTWKDTVLADISASTCKKYRNISKTYGVLPAWGVSDNELCKKMTLDGQKVDEVIEIDVEGKTYYLWYIEDLKTKNDEKNIVVEVKD